MYKYFICVLKDEQRTVLEFDKMANQYISENNNKLVRFINKQDGYGKVLILGIVPIDNILYIKTVNTDESSQHDIQGGSEHA